MPIRAQGSGDSVIAESDRQEHEDLRAGLFAELCPCGQLEIHVFDQIIHAAWILRLIPRLEARILQNEPNPGPLDGLGRYRQGVERSYYRALKELRTLQSARWKLEKTKRSQIESKLKLAGGMPTSLIQ